MNQRRIQKPGATGAGVRAAGRVFTALAVFAVALASAGCGSEQKPAISVGSRPVGEFVLIGEIVAQMLERHLNAEVTRSFDLGSTPLAYQSIVMQQVDIVPENVNAILTTVLREGINPDPVVALERVKNEMDRIAKARVLEPLGMRQRFAMIVSSTLAAERKVKTLTEASKSGTWLMAQTSEFPDRPDGYNALTSHYSLRLEVGPLLLKPAEAYERLGQGYVQVFAGYNTDGQLGSPEFVELEDDRGAFPPGNTCLIVRRDLVSRYERLKPLLDRLSGRFDDDRIRKLNYEVVVKKRTPADVARQFLIEAKLE